MSVGRAGWLFLRAYLLVALLVVVTGLGLEALLLQRAQQALQRREAALAQGGFAYAETLLQDGADRASLQAGVEASLALPAALHRLADFSALGEQHRLLARGEVLQLYDTQDRPVFYRRLADSDWVLALGPAPALDNDRAKLVVPLFYALIAVAVFLWIRPMMRDLEQLRAAAQDFGRQDFRSRVALPAGSWLAPVGEAFNSMARRIEWLLQSHRELTHAVSHELRTPLARLRFSLEMLAAADAEARARRVDSMKQDINELNDLVEEMLGYAELEQGNLTPCLKALDNRQWLARYVQHYNGRNPRIALELDGAAAATIMADERLLTRALDNLVGNAQRYASARIVVSLARCGGEYCLRVVDDGPGIPAAQRESVLRAYVRLADGEEQRRQGFGLGLAIVKRIAELHAGRVEIADAAPGGAAIALRWPA